MFDIKDFQQSIQQDILNKGLRFAEEYIDISGKIGKLFTMLVNHYYLMKRTHG